MPGARDPRIVIVGAGFGGVAAAIELQRHGFGNLTLLERAPRAGRHVVPQHLPGRRLRRPQPPLLVLLRPAARLVADLLAPGGDPRRTCTTSRARPASTAWWSRTATSARARWDDGDARLDGAHRGRPRPTSADAVVLATGQLHQPATPRIEGAETFAGHSFHSAQWDHDYDLRGKRVAVIGTGASAVQFVPEIAPLARRLVVFQRTGNWFLPRQNRAYPPAVRAAIRHVPGLQAARRRFVFDYCESLTAMIRHPRTLGRLGGREVGAPSWPGSCAATPSCGARCGRTTRSAASASSSARTGCPALRRPNVDLVTDAVAGLAPEGVVTADGTLHEVDCVIYGTGFRTNDFMFPMEVTGAGGRDAARRVGAAARTPTSGSRSPASRPVRPLRAQHEHLGRLDHRLPRGAVGLRPPGARAGAPARRRRDRRAPGGRGRRASARCRSASAARPGRAATRGTARPTGGSWPTGRATCASTSTAWRSWIPPSSRSYPRTGMAKTWKLDTETKGTGASRRAAPA